MRLHQRSCKRVLQHHDMGTRAAYLDWFLRVLKKSSSTCRQDVVLSVNTVKHALRVFSSAVSTSTTKPPPLSTIEIVEFNPIERFILM